MKRSELRDYAVDRRMLYVSLLAAGMGAVSAVLAWMVDELIAVSTNVFYFGRWSIRSAEASTHHLGWWVMFMPAIGGLIVGLIARFGSKNIRGHGMPEAVEAVVFKGGKVQPRVALLKPIATAISIGSGGPFGAEGPVIMTAGAVGSLLGQMLPVTDSERTTLMVSGAAAGMAAAFSCPMSAVLLAVEVFLFEWRPRSLVPVAIACITSGAARRLLLGPGPIFPMDLTTAPMHHAAMLWAAVVGGIAAVMAIGLSQAIHFSEGLFERLPVHWMWWPAIGGLLVGAGGLVFPQALGTGYDVVRDLVRHDITWQLLIGILLVKTLVWVIALGSNTAGGILAPLLMIGGAMGAVLGHWLPMISPGAWAIVGMTSLLGAAIGAPLTSTMLAVELTHNGGLMLPVLLACITAYGISILMEPRSMLTEGLSRRGLHLSREYGVDPLELVRVGQAMHTSVFALPAGATRRDAVLWLRSMEERGATAWSHWQRLFPLVDAEGRLTAALTRSQMIQAAGAGEPDRELWRDGTTEPRRMSPGETLRQAAAEMARADLTSYPVVEADGRLAGILTIKDLLTARTREASRDSNRARVLSLRWPFRGGGGSAGSQMARTAERLDGEDVV